MAALEQMAANNFPERAVAMAAEIVEKNPPLIGLQEVYNFMKNGENQEPPFRDYLSDLLQALEDKGASYYVAAIVENLDLSLPIDTALVRLIDRDVILAREDVETEIVDLTSLCRQSMDGCNYKFVLEANSPILGTIAIERGFVAVDTDYGRFFNTHLEVQFPAPDNPFSAFFQSAQAMELIGLINALNIIDRPAGPVIVVGDINSSPEYESIPGIVSPYMQFINAWYVDVWTLRPGNPKGFTCCYEEDLSISEDLYERVDMIFSDLEPSRVKANVVGNDKADQTPSGLWPSDHAGVVVRIEF
jgi:endonuclease/exonuclease/phosphatase family metal-dependent hydrolase